MAAKERGLFRVTNRNLWKLRVKNSSVYVGHKYARDQSTSMGPQLEIAPMEL